jgi:hypothetical protein
MFSDILQHAVVSVVALAASGTLVRRVFGFALPNARRTGCAACPSGRNTCGAPTQATGGAPSQHAAVLIRPPARVRRPFPPS